MCKDNQKKVYLCSNLILMDYNDPAYDEYLSTGIDPTGGQIAPDDDSKDEEEQEECADSF